MNIRESNNSAADAATTLKRKASPFFFFSFFLICTSEYSVSISVVTREMYAFFALFYSLYIPKQWHCC